MEIITILFFFRSFGEGGRRNLVKDLQDDVKVSISLSVMRGQSLMSMDAKEGQVVAIAASAGGPTRVHAAMCSCVKGK